MSWILFWQLIVLLLLSTICVCIVVSTYFGAKKR